MKPRKTPATKAPAAKPAESTGFAMNVVIVVALSAMLILTVVMALNYGGSSAPATPADAPAQNGN